ncbi:hypothetical protein ACIQTU_12985 [Brevundimonas sp. NPDC090276]|uniref:hypothetical protein n=1 Tax=Brevundimonas sp. NPDC090276 TaxID=3363956 RepID=UPI003839EC7F
MTHRQDDPQDVAAPARSADILPFRRPSPPVDTPPVFAPEPSLPSDDMSDDGDDDGPSAA